VLSLVLQPAMRQLERLHLPRGIAALLIIVVLFGTFAGLGVALGVVTVTGTVQRIGEIEPSFMRRQLHLATERLLRL
jgi:predicted PurR-regulated permease PerM